MRAMSFAGIAPTAVPPAGVASVQPPSEASVPPGKVLDCLEEHLLVDGFRLVIDLKRSRGSRIVDATTGQEWLDFYGFFGSLAIGFNHSHFEQADVQKELLEAAKSKIANSDIGTIYLADFVRTFARVMGLPPLERYFFIEGGALAVENALKAAMDWKVRKNLAAGKGSRGTDILHFERAFHGRSGYTMSLTNTDPRKTEHFAKFDWPRVPAPSINFALPPAERDIDVEARERESERSIRTILEQRAQEIAAIIIEPIQGEGGDNHFRGEWLRALRKICDEYDVLLIFDEVQTGVGGTGKNWCCEHFGVMPDLLAFGKKAQACGVMAGPRLDQVQDNCFRLSGRINSTWGGNLADMVRSTHCLQIIERDHLVAHAGRVGEVFLQGLQELAASQPRMIAPRGRGLLLAFDLPSAAEREEFYKGLLQHGLLALRSGERSIRFRPALDVPETVVKEALDLLHKQFKRM